ncbi:MAG: hypothetical protein KBF32_10175 [Chitinophagales bacterium]|nr:hypothetical protein [Chitinophagales bacterium]
MNQKFTFTLIAVCIIYLSQSNALLAVSTESYLLNGPLENSVLPVDTPKKKPAPAPAAAPAALITFPLSAKNKLSLSGYTQARYVYNLLDGVKTNTFDVRRARVDLRGNIGAKWAYRTQIDFAPTTRVLDATVSYTANPYLRVTAGQQKIAFSLENIVSSPLMESINRSQVVEAMVSRSTDVISQSGGNNNGRDIGVQVSGGIPIAVDSTSKRNVFEYYLGVYNGNGINKGDNNVDKDFAGRFLVMPIKGLQIGGSFYKGQGSYGTDIALEKKRDRFGGEVYYYTKRFSFKAEYIAGTDDTISKGGYYAQLAAFALPDKLQFLVKYDSYDANTDKDDNISTIYTIGLNYMPTSWAKLQLAYDIKKEQADEQTKNDQLQVMLQLGF